MRDTIAMACVLTLLWGGAWALQSAPRRHPNPAPGAKHRSASHSAASSHATGARRKAARKPSAAKPQAAAQNRAQAASPSPAGSAQPPASSAWSVEQSQPKLPATLINSPPVKPVIRMEHGLLTIDAPNCTLSDVLNGVAAATGAVIEGSLPGDRVAVRLGPGDARAILAALLRGTQYNYILLGSPTDPHAVTRILISRSRQSSASASPQMIHRPARPAPPPVRYKPEPMNENSPFVRPQESRAEHPPSTSQEQKPPVKKPPANPTSPEELFRQLLNPPKPKK